MRLNNASGRHCLSALLAALCIGYTSSTGAQERAADANATIVLEGAASDRAALANLREHFGATRVDDPANAELEIWQAPADRVGELRRLLELERARANLDVAVDHRSIDYRNILEPTDPSRLTLEQKAILSAIEEDAGRAPTVLSLNAPALVEYALERGFGPSDGLVNSGAFRFDFGGGRLLELQQGAQSRGAADWSGATARGGYGSLISHPGRLSGVVVTPEGATIEIRPIGNGVHAIIERPASGRHVDEPAGFSERAAVGYDSAPDDDGRPSGPVSIDVLVLYTERAVRTVSDPVQSLGHDRIEGINATLTSAGLSGSLRFRLAGVERVSYRESAAADPASHIKQLTGPSALHATASRLRNERRADIVVLIISMRNSKYCGEAGSIGPSRDRAFAVVNQACLHTYAFEHEIGHLFGMRHEVAADPENTPFSYGHGLHVPRLSQGTIMARDVGCSYCARIPRWSDAEALYEGEPFGTVDAENEVRVLRESAATLASYR